MVIKSRNKAVTYLLGISLICAAVLALCTLIDVGKHHSFLSKDSYFRSEIFGNELQLPLNLLKYRIENANYPLLTDEEKIGKERRESWNQAYTAMEKRGKTNARNTYNSKLQEARLSDISGEVSRFQQEFDKQILDVQAEVAKLLEVRKIQYLEYKNKEFSDVANSLIARGESFHYYVRDRKTDHFYSNMVKEPGAAEFEQALFYAELPQKQVSNSFLKGINKFFQQNQLHGYILIPKEAIWSSQMHEDYTYYQAISKRIWLEIGLFVVLCMIAAALVWIMRKKHSFQVLTEEMPLKWLEYVPLDLRVIVTFLSLLLLFNQIGNNSFFQIPLRFQQAVEGINLSLNMILLVILVIDGRRLYRNKAALRKQWNNCLLNTMIQLCTLKVIRKSLRFKVVFVFILTSLFGVSFLITIYWMFALDWNSGIILFAGGYLLAFLFTILPKCVQQIRLFEQILYGVEQMAAGNLTDMIPEKGSGNLSRLAHHVNQMKEGFKASMDNEMKSERMKAELITNVSHDLKTPLTSIINYVDLLKQKDLAPDKVETYIEVLDRKSQRLKVLIDDLFEASKMSSGSVELQVEKVNVSALLEQALAEFSEMMESSPLIFRLQVEHPHIVASLDGRKTWRVFENLISNAIKYAMPNTRVHLSLSEDEDQVFFIIKNVSAFEIDFDAEELFERFKRGDESRQTEGSGLGLAIAKSIMELQGGQLKIDMDGDLFKVTVIMKKK
ncbi:sensor histidine kinase [Paenibacillus alba]|uniref:histidine kinase n=1 Tax=Paenibacillus alba TaxID=1197127 RepID=A0ABU6G9V8_9BACL|nr:HAMP domain-containing sensor histidine kinase [Paenibacillus alba]MEC0230760.1 HAMP domain-containing sensor histidine kinase [Paenibacillus alba]